VTQQNVQFTVLHLILLDNTPILAMLCISITGKKKKKSKKGIDKYKSWSALDYLNVIMYVFSVQYMSGTSNIYLVLLGHQYFQ
jgi:hypothetical protein